MQREWLRGALAGGKANHESGAVTVQPLKPSLVNNSKWERLVKLCGVEGQLPLRLSRKGVLPSSVYRK
jgi:hypothetical protein